MGNSTTEIEYVLRAISKLISTLGLPKFKCLFFSFSNNFVQDEYCFSESVDYFEIAHTPCSILICNCNLHKLHQTKFGVCFVCYCKLGYLNVCKYLRNATILKYTWVVAFAHVWQILVTMSRENALWHERYLPSLINSLKLLGGGN